jgi:outer membrane lipoprotein-sorting protein
VFEVDSRREEQFDELVDRAAEALRQLPVPPGPPPEAIARVLATAGQSPGSGPLSLRERARVRAVGEEISASPLTIQRIKTMKRIARIAVAAALLVAMGALTAWIVIGRGSGNMAFAKVANALDSLRSATYDVTSESKGENGQPGARATGRGFFLAPSHQRMEISVDIGYGPAVKAAAEAARRMHAADSQAGKVAGRAAAEATANAVALMPKMKNVMITIADNEAGKAVMLTPMAKLAIVMDMKKMKEDLKKSPHGTPPDLFEMVRRIVREGSSGTGEKAERLGKKEIDGRQAVGFRAHDSLLGDARGEMTLWADAETARPIRIELTSEMLAGVRMVMNNFRYDVALDPSLFSLALPPGYATQAMNMTMPVEDDLLRTLRTIAEHNKGLFPAKLTMNEEVMKAVMAGQQPVMDKATMEKMEAAMNKVAAKYGGKDELRKKYGMKLPPGIMAEIMKATMSVMQENTQGQLQKNMQEQVPLIQKRTQGLQFYGMLKPENDPHYTGGGVKLGTPARPILWYKPTGSANYRVIYADLSVKDMPAAEAKKLSPAAGK